MEGTGAWAIVRLIGPFTSFDLLGLCVNGNLRLPCVLELAYVFLSGLADFFARIVVTGPCGARLRAGFYLLTYLKGSPLSFLSHTSPQRYTLRVPQTFGRQYHSNVLSDRQDDANEAARFEGQASL